MKIFKQLILILGTGLCVCRADGATHPVNGEFAFQADFLYLFPDVGPTYFVFDAIAPSSNGANATGTLKENAFDFKPGFRLEAAYGLCAEDIRLEWTYLRCNAHRTIHGNALSPTMTVPTGGGGTGVVPSGTFSGTAESRIHLNYDEVSLLYGKRVFEGCALALDVRGGLQYGYVTHKDNRAYSIVDGSFQNTTIDSRFWGIGPEIVLDGSYTFCHWQEGAPFRFSIDTLVSGSLLASQAYSRYNYVAQGPSVLASDWHAKEDKKWTVVPAWHAQVGLNWEICFSCMKVSLEVGYEFTVFNNAISQTSAFNRNVGETRTIYYNFTNQGLYVALDAIF